MQLLKRNSNGPLAEAIATASKHTFAAGINLAPVTREFDGKVPPELAPYAALMAVHCDRDRRYCEGREALLDPLLRRCGRGQTRHAGARRRTQDARTLAAGQAAAMKAASRPEEQPAGSAVRDGGRVAARTAQLSRPPQRLSPPPRSNSVRAAGKAVGTLFQTFFSRKKYLERANNLKQIGLAIHNYHDVNAHLPTNITNAKGEAILSLRVLASLSRTGQSLQAVQAG